MADVVARTKIIIEKNRKFVIDEHDSNYRIDYESASLILKAINKIAAKDRERVINHAQKVFSGTRLEKEDYAYILENISKINENEIEEILTYLGDIHHENIYIPDISNLITSISNIPQDQRAAVVNRVIADRAAADQDGYEYDADEFSRRTTLILERPLHLPLPPIGEDEEDEEDVEYGINVHAGNRDAATKKAIELLILQPTQITLSKEKVLAAYTNFRKHLAKYPNNEIRDKAELALDNNSSKNGFGGLLMERSIFCTENLTGAALIGRLCIFAEIYNNGKEKDLIIDTIVKELAKCFENIREKYKVICNEGKIQHLAVAIIQGRIEGAVIDKAAKESVLPKIVPSAAAAVDDIEETTTQAELLEADLSELFFNINRRKMGPEELISQISDFCEENQLITENREKLKSIIIGYLHTIAEPKEIQALLTRQAALERQQRRNGL